MGREIYRGIFRYVRTHTRWRLVIDASNTSAPFGLPHCDAYIIAAWTDPICDWARRVRGPLVNVSSRRDLNDHFQVRTDDEAVGRLAAQHLIDRAMKRFGYVGPPDETQVRARLHGFATHLAARGHACEVHDWRVTDGRLDWNHLRSWLSTRDYPVAIFCNNDDTGRLVTQACWECGIAVPEQVAVLGVDNDEVFCEASQPALSSIETGTSRVGMEAARYIELLLAGQTPDPRDLRIAPTNVQERASTDVVAIDDPDLAAALQFIREHACDGITVDDALKVTGLNRRLLERRFKQHVGCSPLEQIHRVRMNRALDLLTNTSLPLKQVSEKSGFTYLQSFYRTFTAHFGESPGDVRKKALVG
jgi:LacI family transcriptional regulator